RPRAPRTEIRHGGPGPAEVPAESTAAGPGPVARSQSDVELPTPDGPDAASVPLAEEASSSAVNLGQPGSSDQPVSGQSAVEWASLVDEESGIRVDQPRFDSPSDLDLLRFAGQDAAPPPLEPLPSETSAVNLGGSAINLGASPSARTGPSSDQMPPPSG